MHGFVVCSFPVPVVLATSGAGNKNSKSETANGRRKKNSKRETGRRQKEPAEVRRQKADRTGRSKTAEGKKNFRTGMVMNAAYGKLFGLIETRRG